MPTREAAPTATTDSRIEIGIGGYDAPLLYVASESTRLRSNQIGTSSTRRPRAPEQTRQRTTQRPRFYAVCRRQGSLSPRERTSLRQHDLDCTHIRRSAVLRSDLLRRDADVSYLGVGDEAPADDLGDIDGARDRTSAGFDDDLARPCVEIRDDREHVIHRRFLPDVHDARVDRESATTGTSPNPAAPY